MIKKFSGFEGKFVFAQKLLKKFLQEVEFMFDKKIFENYLTTYKQDFLPTWWNDEKYKWEMVKHFQDNWNIEAENFSEMLKESLAKTDNLLAANFNFPCTVLLNMFAKNEPETVRKMFCELFDEKIDVWERIDNFKSESSNLLKKYGKSKEQHHQTENAISIYLWLRYPEKYYIYKFGVVKKVSEVLKSNFIFKTGHYEDNIRDFYKFYDEICEELQKDKEIAAILKNNLTENCYLDTELKTLTQDFGFYISKH